MTKYIDIGANLTGKKFNNIPKLLENARDANVERIIITGTSVAKSKQALELCGKYPWYPLFATAGIHPHDAKGFNLKSVDELAQLLANPRVLAIGECGLDYNRMFSTKEQQINCFRTHLDLAVKFCKPLFLHERDATDDFYNILAEYQGRVRGVVHCFTGNQETVQRYLNVGMHIGITGWICDERRNANLLKALPHIPLDKLMVETDCPFLSPIGSHTNVPTNISHIVTRIAIELGRDDSELARTIYNNTCHFFAERTCCPFEPPL